MNTSRRNFLKGSAGIVAAASTVGLMGCNKKDNESAAPSVKTDFKSNDSYLIVEKNNALQITGTFLDEISHDIPHQNWGPKEWEQDFKYMKSIGIDTVIMIRCGYRKFITWPCEYLMSKGCYKPSMDTLELFMSLADKYDMTFYLGLYDSGVYWDTGKMDYEVESNKYVVDEFAKKYMHHKSFGGWYISTEISRNNTGCAECIRDLAKLCKDHAKVPTFISPWIDGKKAVEAGSGQSTKEGISVSEHEKEWNDIFSGIHDYVNAVAFQDGHIDYDELDTFFNVNKKLADKWGMQCWTNAESFDRDMPIDFLPIKFDKLRMKLEAAKRCNYDKAITFEFSHFMSPQSAYHQAGNLYNRYRDYFGIN